MLIPLRQQNLHPIGALLPAPEDQRVFLKRKKPRSFYAEPRTGIPEMPQWGRPYIPEPPPPLAPVYVATVDELISRANARTDFTEEEQMMALLLMAA